MKYDVVAIRNNKQYPQRGSDDRRIAEQNAKCAVLLNGFKEARVINNDTHETVYQIGD